MPPKNLVWLASYPKSGNTWCRIFLANYIVNSEDPVPINQVHRFGMGDSVAKAYDKVARAPFDQTDPQQTLALRGAVLSAIAGNGADVNLVKTHNIRADAFGTTLIPQAMTRAAVYILRNPLDMVLSYQRHYGGTLAETVERIGRSDNIVAGDAASTPQYLGSWSEHVESWTIGARFPVLVLRYEDMQADPQGSFSRLITHLGMPVDPVRRDRAIRHSSFAEVSRQEASTAFIEKSPIADRFFHSGTSGQWKDAMAPDLIDRVQREHRKIMKKYGYL